MPMEEDKYNFNLYFNTLRLNEWDPTRRFININRRYRVKTDTKSIPPALQI